GPVRTTQRHTTVAIKNAFIEASLGSTPPCCPAEAGSGSCAFGDAPRGRPSPCSNYVRGHRPRLHLPTSGRSRPGTGVFSCRVTFLWEGPLPPSYPPSSVGPTSALKGNSCVSKALKVTSRPT